MKWVSIVGDSISTFEGYNPQGYMVYYDKEMQEKNGLRTVYDTWWARVNQALHAFLCVNNSYSGSRVSGKEFPAGENKERLSNLRTADHDPDIILVYIGFNDFGNGVTVPRRKLHWIGNDKTVSFEGAYDSMLKTIKSYYPEAKIICGTLMRTKIKEREGWRFPEMFAGVGLEEYNDAIRKIVRKNHCYLADVAETGEMYETLDGSHPTADGHATIANAWIYCINKMSIN